MDLKIGGNNVGKIMYNGQEFGGATKLEPGTIFYMSDRFDSNIKNLHLLSTTKNWNNLNGINVSAYNGDFSVKQVDVDIPSDDFKNLNINKSYIIADAPKSMNISTSIVDGEYMLNIDTNNTFKYIIKAI